MTSHREFAHPLPPGEVHLWYADPAEFASDASLAACRRMLSPGERETAARFAREHDRQLYLVSHALLRCALSRDTQITPAQWQFRTRAQGKPYLAGPMSEDSIHFNLSHTAGLVACAVCRDCELGVDVESSARQVELSALARRFFSHTEAADLAHFPAQGRQQRFYQYWTLKEAYIKATGAGLRIPLESFTMRLPAVEDIDSPPEPFEPPLALPPPTIVFAPSPVFVGSVEQPPNRAPGQWQFAQYLPTAEHVLSLAIDLDGRPPLNILPRKAPGEFMNGGG